VKLRSGTPVWCGTDPVPPTYEPLAGDASCEVLIVGGGVTGGLLARRLATAGVDVALVDRGLVGAASTAASTGLLQYEVDTHLADLVDKVGEAHAVHAYRRGLTAIDEIESLVESLGHPCGFSRRASLYFAGRFWHYRRLRREFECRRAHGFDVEFLDRKQLAEVSSIRAAGAIRSRGDAQIDPLCFTQELVGAAVAVGARAHERTSIDQVDVTAEGVLARTNRGTIQARQIIYSTGYDTKPFLAERAGTLHSTYALAGRSTPDVPGWPDECLIWETARPYFYARRTDGGRTLIGGADTAFASDHDRDALLDRKVAALCRRFERLFPHARLEPEFAWGGTFAETKDGLAYIGSPPDRPREFFALGYGGNGITFGVIAARLLADLIMGRPNPDAEVFRFGR
jgi:glycine/D-amino acid oxidase-like deaminating enzyme